jgi:hypothetical protein
MKTQVLRINEHVNGFSDLQSKIKLATDVAGFKKISYVEGCTGRWYPVYISIAGKFVGQVYAEVI